MIVAGPRSWREVGEQHGAERRGNDRTRSEHNDTARWVIHVSPGARTGTDNPLASDRGHGMALSRLARIGGSPGLRRVPNQSISRATPLSNHGK